MLDPHDSFTHVIKDFFHWYQRYCCSNDSEVILYHNGELEQFQTAAELKQTIAHGRNI